MPTHLQERTTSSAAVMVTADVISAHHQVSGEAKLAPHELFYSKTDKRGILFYGNSIFVRISEYDDEALNKKPHNIIRNQDMPKTLFKLFWDYLKRDEPVVAYIKNKSRSGKYYWVLSLAFSVPDGYVSIRLKPSTDLLKKAEELYKAVRVREQGEFDINDTTQFMLDQLKLLGFDGYDAFMQHVLNQELLACYELLNSRMVSDGDESKNVNEQVELKEIPLKAFQATEPLMNVVKELIGLSVTINLRTAFLFAHGKVALIKII